MGSVNSLGFNDAGFFINYKWLLNVEDERKRSSKMIYFWIGWR